MSLLHFQVLGTPEQPLPCCTASWQPWCTTSFCAHSLLLPWLKSGKLHKSVSSEHIGRAHRLVAGLTNL